MASEAAGSLDRSGPIPLYYQLYSLLLDSIESGTYAPGDCIPGERELEDIYSVSQITIRRALAKLVADGVIVRQPGRGSFVLRPRLRFSMVSLERASERYAAATSGDSRVEYEIQGPETVPAPERVALAMDLDAETPLQHFLRVLRQGGEPRSVSDVYLNLGPERGFTYDELMTGSVIPQVKHKYNIELVRVDQVIEAIGAPEQILRLLELEPGGPVLSVDSLFFDGSGKPVLLVTTFHRGDRYKFQQTVVFRATDVDSLRITARGQK